MGGALEEGSGRKSISSVCRHRCIESGARCGTAAGAESFSVANNQRGIATLVKRLQKLSVSRIVLEASGGYEIAAASELAAAGLSVAVVNPRQV
jgi:transposase